MSRQVPYGRTQIKVSPLLAILCDLDATPGSLSSELAAHAGISRSTLQRLLAAAERDLDIIVGATRNPGGMWIESWGILNRSAVIQRAKKKETK